MKNYIVTVYTGFAEFNDYEIEATNKQVAIYKALDEHLNYSRVTKVKVREGKPDKDGYNRLNIEIKVLWVVLVFTLSLLFGIIGKL